MALKVYVAAPWVHREYARKVAEQVRCAGFWVVSRWLWFHGESSDPQVLAREAQNDLDDLRRSDVFLLLNKVTSEGKAVETGVALQMGLPIILVGKGNTTNVFHHLPQIHCTDSVDGAIERLRHMAYERQSLHQESDPGKAEFHNVPREMGLRMDRAHPSLALVIGVQTHPADPMIGIGGAPTRATTLPEDAAGRKQYPVASGVLDYFPDALVALAHLSWKGNEQHNPGQPLHWARSKSTDEADTMLRHFLQRGTFDTDGVRHTVKMAWRALALLQKEIEDERRVTGAAGAASRPA